jgi:hypothetical protein
MRMNNTFTPMLCGPSTWDTHSIGEPENNQGGKRPEEPRHVYCVTTPANYSAQQERNGFWAFKDGELSQNKLKLSDALQISSHNKWAPFKWISISSATSHIFFK